MKPSCWWTGASHLRSDRKLLALSTHIVPHLCGSLEPGSGQTALKLYCQARRHIEWHCCLVQGLRDRSGECQQYQQPKLNSRWSDVVNPVEPENPGKRHPLTTRHFSSTRFSLSFFLLIFLCPVAKGQDKLSQQPGETFSHFEYRLLPHGTVPASPVREVMLGPFAHAFVLLFGETPENYDEGWVLTPLPGTPGQYRKYVLPPTDEINLSRVASPSFQVKSVFSAPLRQGTAPSLFVVFLVKGASAVRQGGGRSYEQEYVTGVYHWTGIGFAFDGLSDRLAGSTNKAAVRLKLHALTARRSGAR